MNNIRVKIFAGVFLLFCFAVQYNAFGQSQSNVPVVEVVSGLEKTHKVQFFYQNDWLDSLSFSGDLQGDFLEDKLAHLFDGTSINYFLFEGSVILTKNVAIIDDPEITKSFLAKEKEVSIIEKGLVFSREYVNQAEASDLENYVFEIGNRNELVSGGKSTIAGYVKNMEDEEGIEGALVYTQNPFIAASTDENGFYSLKLPNGKHTLFIQFVGMKTTTRNIVLFSNGRMDIEMAVDIIALQEVLVESDRDINVSNVQMGVRKIDIEESKNIPILLGEKDLMKVSTTE
ncbi:MAG: carboxypeptidase-like regulatory domain-containing protein, partial [Cyclobacteriaceae bacterium]